jgi:hypothetical protein
VVAHASGPAAGLRGNSEFRLPGDAAELLDHLADNQVLLTIDGTARDALQRAIRGPVCAFDFWSFGNSESNMAASVRSGMASDQGTRRQYNHVPGRSRH